MIENVYITNKGGVCLFSRHYVLDAMDDVLLTSLASTIFHLTNESTNDELQEICLKKKSIHYYSKDSFLTIIVTSKEENPRNTQELSQKILKSFQKHHSNNISNKLRPMNFFQDFEQDLDSFR